MPTLSCVQKHIVYVSDRGGDRRIFQPVDLSRVEWGRTLSGSATLTVEVAGEPCRRQRERLAKVQPRRHELVIYREDGRVAEGPIVDVKYEQDKVTIIAKDVVEYLAGTPLSKWWPSAEEGGPALATARIEEIINYELTTSYTMPVHNVMTNFDRWEQLSPPANVLPHLDVRAGTLEVEVDTIPFEMTVAEHLLNLSKVGLRFTTVGRKLLIWDTETIIGQTRTMTEADLGERHNLYATSVGFTCVQHVTGSPSGDPNDTDHVGTAGATDLNYYGAWTLIDTHTEDRSAAAGDDDPLQSQADQLYLQRAALPLEVVLPSGASLRLSTTLKISDLVPGVFVPLSANLYGRRVSSSYLLEQVTVTETGAGEDVKITLVSSEEEAA